MHKIFKKNVTKGIIYLLNNTILKAIFTAGIVLILNRTPKTKKVKFCTHFHFVLINFWLNKYIIFIEKKINLFFLQNFINLFFVAFYFSAKKNNFSPAIYWTENIDWKHFYFVSVCFFSFFVCTKRIYKVTYKFWKMLQYLKIFHHFWNTYFFVYNKKAFFVGKIKIYAKIKQIWIFNSSMLWTKLINN